MTFWKMSGPCGDRMGDVIVWGGSCLCEGRFQIETEAERETCDELPCDRHPVTTMTEIFSHFFLFFVEMF